MPDKLTISNTSPLLYLHLVRQLDLLPRLYGEVFVPPAVEAELQAGAERGVDVPSYRDGVPPLHNHRSPGRWSEPLHRVR